MRFHFVTLFPEMMESALSYGVVGQAIKKGLLTVATTNPRDFSSGVHKAVDDRPFGGGDGMIFLPEILGAAIAHAESQENLSQEAAPAVRKIYLSARGAVFNEAKARELAQEPRLILVCGRYGGIDERVRAACDLEELSVGDFILSGGELAALSVTDAIARHCPGVLGNQVSAQEESFSNGLLEHPQFTRPREWRDMSVPDVLMSGNHAQINEWKQNLALLVTAQNRADLLKMALLSPSRAQAALQLLSSMSLSDQKACGLFKLELIKERLEQILIQNRGPA